MARKIVAAAGKFETAFEIGPGLGALTGAVLERGSKLVAVEIDRRLCEHLRLRFEGESRLDLIESDALKLDWAERLSGTPAPRVIFGNLPYSIFAPLMEKMFQHAGFFSEAILCLPSEVSDRVVAAGGRAMGPMTILAHRFCARREKLFRVSPGGFWPPPKIGSTVIRLVFRPGTLWTEADRQIPRLLFAHRRKKLSSVLPPEILTGAGDSKSRAFGAKRIDELTVEEAVVLSDRLRGLPGPSVS